MSDNNFEDTPNTDSSGLKPRQLIRLRLHLGRAVKVPGFPQKALHRTGSNSSMISASTPKPQPPLKNIFEQAHRAIDEELTQADTEAGQPQERTAHVSDEKKMGKPFKSKLPSRTRRPKSRIIGGPIKRMARTYPY